MGATSSPGHSALVYGRERKTPTHSHKHARITHSMHTHTHTHIQYLHARHSLIRTHKHNTHVCTHSHTYLHRHKSHTWTHVHTYTHSYTHIQQKECRQPHSLQRDPPLHSPGNISSAPWGRGNPQGIWTHLVKYISFFSFLEIHFFFHCTARILFYEFLLF